MIEETLIEIIKMVEIVAKRAQECKSITEKAACEAAGFEMIANYLKGGI